MIDVYDLTKRFNHRWQTDPLFLKDFDYDQPKYANVPDDIKWMLPMHEAQKSPGVMRGHAEVVAQVQAQLFAEGRERRLQSLRKFQCDDS